MCSACRILNYYSPSQILTSHERSDGLISDYCDGSLYQSHNLFKTRKDALQLVLYFDEIEVCNPLGAQRGIHKLGMFYYMIANLRPELRSTHRSIQLVACVTCPNLQKYGFEPVLEPFLKDVKKLAEVSLILYSIYLHVHTFLHVQYIHTYGLSLDH